VATAAQHDQNGAAPPKSVLRALNAVNRRLEHVLLELRTEADADRQLRALAQEIMDAVACNPDVALACIYLNQIAGIYAVRHCVEAAVVAVLVGRALGRSTDELRLIAGAALTMNVGMVRHAERFQNKGADLDAEERSIIRRHPEEGADLLRSAGIGNAQWIDYVLLHHENEDGSGYPEGRSGVDIPQNAKLIALADRYCACVSARNYRRSLRPDEALDTLFGDAATAVGTPLEQAFREQIGKTPPGTLVCLENGEIGVVAHRLDGTGAVQVHVLRDAAGHALADAPLRRTSDPGCAVQAPLHEDDAHLRFAPKSVWGPQAAL
jgi:HD-GYP domain-containing protein (c-di-GMP phosphodiesterase class II)